MQVSSRPWLLPFRQLQNRAIAFLALLLCAGMALYLCGSPLAHRAPNLEERRLLGVRP